jgi:hypothetical protein
MFSASAILGSLAALGQRSNGQGKGRGREGGFTLVASSHIGEGHGDTVVEPCARGHWYINSSSSSSSAIGGCGQRVAIVGVGVGVGVVVARRRSSLSSF